MVDTFVFKRFTLFPIEDIVVLIVDDMGETVVLTGEMVVLVGDDTGKTVVASTDTLQEVNGGLLAVVDGILASLGAHISSLVLTGTLLDVSGLSAELLLFVANVVDV